MPAFGQKGTPEAPAKPTVSIDSNYPAIGSGAANAFRKQVGQLTQYLQTDCGLKVIVKADKADYLVKLTYTEWGWMHRAASALSRIDPGLLSKSDPLGV